MDRRVNVLRNAATCILVLLASLYGRTAENGSLLSARVKYLGGRVLSDDDRAEMNRPEGYCAVQGAGGSVKVLFLGNSTALHGPKPEIGWTNNWGMAASAPEKDYVHLTTRGIERHLGAKAEMRVRNVYGFECGYRTWDIEANLKEEIAFRPDYLILGFGGNAKDLGKPENAAAWGKAVDRLIDLFTRADGSRPVVVVVGGFWPKEELDVTLRAAAKRHAAPFVKSDFAGEPGMYAKGLFWHKGVEGHPGDRGMAERARRILSVLFPEDGGQQKEGR